MILRTEEAVTTTRFAQRNVIEDRRQFLERGNILISCTQVSDARTRHILQIEILLSHLLIHTSQAIGQHCIMTTIELQGINHRGQRHDGFLYVSHTISTPGLPPEIIIICRLHDLVNRIGIGPCLLLIRLLHRLRP